MERSAAASRHWKGAELLAPTAEGRYRRLFLRKPRIRSATLGFAAGDAVPEHCHPDSDEIFYVISGHGRIGVEGEVFDVEPGDVLYIEAGERHTILVAGSASEPLVLLAAVAPDLGNDAIFSDEPFAIEPPG